MYTCHISYMIFFAILLAIFHTYINATEVFNSKNDKFNWGKPEQAPI